MLKRIVSGRWFALADLFLVLLSGLLWTFRPEIGALPVIAIALLPWGMRIAAGLTPFKTTPQDWLVAIFLITAGFGYWAAYDREAAWSKVWFVILAVLLYYALAAQPEENFEWVCSILFCIGWGVSAYFFLTQDFVALPRKVELVNRIGRWIMAIVPRPGWTPLHPNYVAGVSAVLTPFALYPARKLTKSRTLLSMASLGIIGVGCGLALLAILMATSRGILMAVASAFGAWILWQVVNLNGTRFGVRREAVFPSLILVFLFAVILFLYLGPANSGSPVSDHYYYGMGSRSELAARSLYLLFDFPFTGGGLASFPGLYSHYLLGIPNFNVPNSHNLFLDVALEQGMFGGAAFLLIFLSSIWFSARRIANDHSSQGRLFAWLIFFALLIAFVHGLVDDYLYNGSGSLLLLSLAGVSAMARTAETPSDQAVSQLTPRLATLMVAGFLVINLSNVRAAWIANLGAVQMAKVELAGFPTNQWADASILPRLEPVKTAFHSALQSDPTNRTANHRLGLMAMLGQDFPMAATYLERAEQKAPNHRGILKSLGYCYVWLGNMDKAKLLLGNIPEAKTELKVYVWWWGIQGQADLAEKASAALIELNR